MTVAEVCVLSISGNPGELIVAPPQSGGELPLDAVDENTFIRYSSTVAASQTRQITVKWGPSDSAPAGCLLNLKAQPSGKTNEGSGSGEITLSDAHQTLVSGIGSCATGTGGSDGARLIYRLAVDDEALLVQGETKTATVLFTLTDVS